MLWRVFTNLVKISYFSSLRWIKLPKPLVEQNTLFKELLEKWKLVLNLLYLYDSPVQQYFNGSKLEK